MASRRVAACVVTGFLGSGKTTLLRELLERDPGRERIAVIVNEVGDVGIDGRVLTGFDFVENVVELASGCVCCSIDEYRFDLAVDELVRRLDPALLVLETTGLADPGPTLERLRRCGLGVDAVVTVVDAASWKVAWRVSGTARRQVRAADFLVITKCDLVSRRRIDRLRANLLRLNPRALVLESTPGAGFAGAELLLATTAARRCALRPEAIDSAGTGDAGDAPGAGHADRTEATGGTGDAHAHLDDDRFESFSWRSSRPVDREAFEQMLGKLPAEVLRAKGFLRGRDGGVSYLFQVVCGRVELTGFDAGAAIDVGVQAVFLGPGILAMRDAIVTRLAACELPPDDAGCSNAEASRSRRSPTQA